MHEQDESTLLDTVGRLKTPHGFGSTQPFCNAPHDAVPLGHPGLDAPLDVAGAVHVVVDVGEPGVDEGRLAPRLAPRSRGRRIVRA